MFLGQTDYRKWVFLITGCLLGLILIYPLSINYFYDDAYIHARLVENFLDYGQPVFNVNAPIFKVGSSTGYIFLISSFSIFFDPLSAIYYIESSCIIITLGSLSFLVAICSSSKNLLRNLIIAIAIIPFFLVAAYGGMETPIVCMLLTIAAIAIYYKQYNIVLLLISIAAWFRFEVIVLLTLLIFYSIYIEKLRLKILVYTLPLLILFITELYFFGTIIPHAAKVKSIGYNFPLINSIVNALNFHTGKKGFLVGILLVITLFIRLIQLIKRKFLFNIADIFYAFVGAILLAWMVSKSSIFLWYYCLVCFCYGLAMIIDQNSIYNANGVTDGLVMNKIIRFIMLLVIILLGSMGAKIVLDQFTNLNENLVSSNVNSVIRVQRYLEIGAGLYSFCPNCSLVTSEIGGLGYSFKGAVYDGFGLADPEAMQFHPMKVPEARSAYGIGAIPTAYVAYRNPDLIVSIPIFTESFRKSSLVDQYTVYDCLLTPSYDLVFGYPVVQIFSKKLIPEVILKRMQCKLAKD